MGATVLNIPEQIYEMVRYTEYITRISKSEIYRKAISYFIDNDMDVTEEVLYMPLAKKNCKEQVYIESCLPLLEEYIEKLRDKCEEGIFCIAQGKGVMQKKNRYRKSTVVLQAMINYLVYLYSDEDLHAPEVERGLTYINEEKLIGNGNRS